MKKLLLLFIAIVGALSLTAQNPDDLVISGYVTNTNNLAIANQLVCVYSDSTTTPLFTQCVYTNNNGWYTVTIPDGSLTGPNQTYTVSTLNCNGNYLYEYVSNNQGALDIATVSFQICIAGCQANYTYQVNGQTVSFDASSSSVPSGSSIYSWSFGDGSSAAGIVNPTHTYTNSGTYTVCLIVGNNNGCLDTICNNITVGQQPCGVSFTYNASPLGVYTFTATIPGTMTNPQFFWEFGDSLTSTVQNPSHNYNYTGLYLVCLTVSGGGMTCTYCDSLYYSSNPNLCDASFLHTQSGNTVSFTSLSPNTNSQHFWDFGDGNTSNMANPTNTYPSQGTYTVCHTIWDFACADTVCQTITISTTPPCNVSYTYSTQNLLPNQIQFFGILANPSVNTIWNWHFGDGTTATGTQNPIHQYAQSGYYSVCVNLTNNGTITCAYCDSIYVPSVPSVTCNAQFTFQQSGSTVHFFNNNSGTPSSTTMIYTWDFGDGNTSALVNPTHTYTAPGTYSVCLTVHDSLNNCYDQYCTPILTGTNTNCQASFQYTYGSIFNAAFFGNFTPMSTNLQWFWSFGDSTFSTVQNPIHNYQGPGTYHVCLTVVSPNCPAVTYCDTVVIQGNTTTCQAYYTYQVNNTDVHFNSLNMTMQPGQYYNYYWDFGDSTYSTLENPVHTYNVQGTYTVCLTIIDSLNNCSDQFCQTITLANNVQLSGQIFCGNNPADMGTVYLLSVTPGSSNGVTPIASTTIQAGGIYQFSNVPYGQYLIQAHLDQSSVYFFAHLPTYYGDVLYWSQATFVTIGQVNLTVQYDIHMLSTNPNNSGNGQISGNVLQGTGSKSTTEDVLIILLDEYDNALTYTYSDATGNFSFNNLPWGTYKVMAEVWGKDPINATIILSQNNPVVNNVVIVLNETEVIASLPGFNEEYFDFIGLPYPNPATSAISLELGLKQHTLLNINIYNILGVSVLTQQETYLAGTHRLDFNTESLPAGIYYIDIMVNNSIRVSKIFNKTK